MALPRLALPSPAPGADSAAGTPVPSGPSLAAQALPDTGQPTQYLLRDEGGMVAVYTCGPDGSPTALPGRRIFTSTSCQRMTRCVSNKAWQ